MEPPPWMGADSEPEVGEQEADDEWDHNPLAEERVPLLPKLDPAAIGASAKKFKTKTDAVEGIRPRAFARFSSGALEVLCDICQIVEMVGDFPKSVCTSVN